MTEYEALLASIIVRPKSKPIYSEEATTIAIDDEGGGPFVVVEQNGHKIGINPDEWPILRDAINRMIAVCTGSSTATDPGERVSHGDAIRHRLEQQKKIERSVGARNAVSDRARPE